MSAIKDKIQWYQYLVDANREKGIIDASLERDLDVTKEISDRLDAINEIAEMLKAHSASIVNHTNRLDALEEKAHEHNPPVSVVSQSPMPVEVPPPSTLYTGDTERSCIKCRSYNGCQATAEELGFALPEKGCVDYEPKPDTERSCRNCNLLVGCKVVLSSGQDCCDFWEQYVPRPKQPAQEQLTGRADGLCPKCMKSIGATTLCPFCGEHFEPYTQEQGGDYEPKCNHNLCATCKNRGEYCYKSEACKPCINNPTTNGKENRWVWMEQSLRDDIDDLRRRLEQAQQELFKKDLALGASESSLKDAVARLEQEANKEREKYEIYQFELDRANKAEAKVNELTAELEKQKASAFETGELALKRGFEIERLEKENAELKRIFPAICSALGNGACCSTESSIEFLREIPNEVAAVVKKFEAENAELKRKLSEAKP